MDVVWSRRLERFAVGDVLAVLERKREIAYTTVMTTLARLVDKGVLARDRDGKRYLYTACFTREEFLRTTAREVLESIDASGGQHSLALLAETIGDADAAELAELERLIRRRRKELGR